MNPTFEGLKRNIKQELDKRPKLDRENKHYQSIITKIERFIEKKEFVSFEALYEFAEFTLLDRLTMGYADWSYAAAGILMKRMEKEKADTVGEEATFLDTLKFADEQGLLDKDLLVKYTRDELIEAGSYLDESKNDLFSYVGLSLIYSRYLIKTHNKKIVELPQERWLVIALTLMQNETENRMEKVKEAYWAMSNLYMTVATPTLSNAGKSHGQLSSCFIDTVEDSLQDIYDSNTDVATLSKFGGGIGVYMGKVRSKGSDIRGFKNVSGGVIPWIRQLNNTAISVDQLGQRQGAIAVYLDIWHKDFQQFIKMRTNSGESRNKAHDIFLGACIPDIFMEQVDNRGKWYLFDPHEIKTKLGINLEDLYDEEEGDGSFRKAYWDIVNNHPEVSRVEVNALDVMKEIMASQLETGVPYMFFRDEANRENPNKDKGMIYASNLCTEIMQNTSATTLYSKKILDEDGEMLIQTLRRPGDFVVCNLSSINLARSLKNDILERLIPIQVRMLDNVIEINSIPVEQAEITNSKYRGIGLGTFGWHQALAEHKIYWESDEAVSFADKIYEKIAYLTIKASNDLSKEKSPYPAFINSEWHTGAYIERKYEQGYISQNELNWTELKEEVKEYGLRNGYLLAVAPNSSTAIIADSTSGIDPVFALEYNEEKKDMVVPVVAAGLTPDTFPYYQKTSFLLDQNWSIKQNAARQHHIDQAVSFNIYLEFNIQAKKILDYHMEAWKSKLKTVYYTRSTLIEPKVCESCES